MAYMDGDVTLPTGKVDAKPVTQPSKQLSASEFNSVTAAIDSVRERLLGGATAGHFHGLLDAGAAPVSGAGGVRIRNSSGRLQASEDTRQYRPVALETVADTQVNPTGAVDSAIQNALNSLPVALRHGVTIPVSGSLGGFNVASFIGAGSITFDGGSIGEAQDTSAGTTQGTAGTGTTPTSLVKPTGELDWDAHDMQGRFVFITDGGGAGAVRAIRDNSTTALEIDAIPGLDDTSVFLIGQPDNVITSEVTIEGCVAPIIFKGVQFTADVNTLENRKVIFENCQLSGGDWLSNYDERIQLINCVVSDGHKFQASAASKSAEIYGCVLVNGQVRVEDCPLIAVQAKAVDCAANAVYLTNARHAQVNVKATGCTVTPFYFEAIQFLEAIGTDKITGTGNTGYGVSINTAGRYRLIGCDAAGSLGDIDFDGDALTWANLTSATYGVATKHGSTLVGEAGESKSLEYKSKTFLETVEISGRLLTFGYHNMSQTTGLTAAGSNASDALQLGQYVYNRVDTVAAGTGVKLTNGAVIPGALAIVHNKGANTLEVYPYSGGTVDGGASVTLAVGEIRTFISTSSDGLSFTTLAVH